MYVQHALHYLLYRWHFIESMPKGGITISITFWYRVSYHNAIIKWKFSMGVYFRCLYGSASKCENCTLESLSSSMVTVGGTHKINLRKLNYKMFVDGPSAKIYSSKIFSYMYMYVLVIAWAQVPHVGYWHCSGLEPEGHRPEGSKPLLCQ